MPAILLHLLAATLYAALAVHFWRTRWRGALLAQPVTGLLPWERWLLLAALALHGITVGQEIFNDGAMRFGFSVALSLMIWLAITLYWIESFYARMDGLQMLGLPLATVGVLLPAIFPSQHLLVNADSAAFRAHFLMAMLAYSLFTLAALHALLMALAEKRLHQGRLSPLLAGLPPLLTMEALLFRLIHIAFLLLTLTLISGIFFSETLFGKALAFNHKTVFAILSWLIFAALLIGRHLRGWRGRLALRWTLSGFAALLLAYVGSRFVLEVILGRVA
ncbi:MAG: cytochrome C biogenesis protein [Rhodocyclaceae bacterium]|nr:MAG: cytochrome C biogenesis protein [Rhodocyclaceae bacterium]